MSDDNDSTAWVREIAAEVMVSELVLKHHTHLERATIVVVSKPKASKKAGKIVYATIQVASDLVRILSEEDPDYVITLGRDEWGHMQMDMKWAILDHELCHADGRDEESEKWLLVGHDVEEFGAVIRRHGLWRLGLRAFAEVLEPALDAFRVAERAAGRRHECDIEGCQAVFETLTGLQSHMDLAHPLRVAEPAAP